MDRTSSSTQKPRAGSLEPYWNCRDAPSRTAWQLRQSTDAGFGSRSWKPTNCSLPGMFSRGQGGQRGAGVRNPEPQLLPCSDATLTFFPVSGLLLRGPVGLPGHIEDVPTASLQSIPNPNPVQPSFVSQEVPSFTELWIELNKWEPCYFALEPDFP